jgi:hypothetical protein
MRNLVSMCVGMICILGLVTGARAQEPPDLSGVWVTYRGGGGGGGGRGAPGGGGLPFRPEAQTRVDRYQELTGPTADRPGLFCLGSGMPGSMLGAGGAGYPMEIIQRPEQMTIIFENMNEIRRIYFGDRILRFEDRLDERNGYSAGRWEGDTLVIETTHLREQIDQRYAHSDQASIVERITFTVADDGTNVLTDEMTMTDPVFYTEPVSATMRVQRDPDGIMLTYECNEPNWIEHLKEIGATSASN